MAVRKPVSSETRRAALVDSVRNKGTGNATALYTYLSRNLQSPRLRQILEDGAQEHEEEIEVARRA